MAGPELSVVCKSCGAEVSPYVTECPYCGTRLRRRAPKLEREGDEIRVRESMRERRRRRAAERRAEAAQRRASAALAAERPYVTIAAILAPSVLLVVQRAFDLTTYDVGAIVGIVDGDWWRYLAAPFVYDDVGYLFAVALALAIFATGIERRVGPVATLLLLVACGSLGMLAAVGLDEQFGDGVLVAAGGNTTALGALGAWTMLRRAEVAASEDHLDTIALVVAAAVLLALPAVEDYASFWAGIVAGLVGLGAGYSATLGRRGG